MPLRKYRSLSWYFSLYEFVGKYRLKNNDIDVREVHTLLVATLTTSLLMWAYAFLAWHTIKSPVPGIVGFIVAAAHLASPLLYRVSNNTFLVTNIMLLTGILHQGSFAFYTGGFNSNILIWYGIIPMLGGLCAGRRCAILWAIITTSIAFVFFIMFISGFEYPYLITGQGFVWAQGLLVFGWIFLSSSIVIVYAGLREHTEKLLQEQNQKIDDLFRVLFHDLANPLGRISIGLSIAKKQLEDGEKNRGLEIAQSASDSMLDITQHVRKMYAVRRNKTTVDLSPLYLNSAVDYIQKIYAEELQKKNQTILYDFDFNKNLKILVEPVSFKNQVLGNLISNAIKFSPRDSEIKISSEVLRNGFIAVKVTDSGIGIPESLIPHLFDINKKTSRPGTSGEQGTGFGMNIMKSFVDMYQGKIEIQSREGDSEKTSGTTVKIILKGELE